MPDHDGVEVAGAFQGRATALGTHVTPGNKLWVNQVSPNVLIGARAGLRNLRPAILEPSVLWNADELFWAPAPGR